MEPSDVTAMRGYGRNTAISEGNAAVSIDSNPIGGPQRGAVYAYAFQGGTWQETGLLMASNGAPADSFGIGLAVSGDVLLVGAPDYGVASAPATGLVYRFERTPAGWVETEFFTGSDSVGGNSFGISIALDGVRALIGDHFDDQLSGNSGAMYVFDVSNSQ